MIVGQSKTRQVRVLHVSGIIQETPQLLPVPPIAGGAPCWNIFRLHEALNREQTPIHAETISACEQHQLSELSHYPQNAIYRHIIIPSWKRQLSVWLQQQFPITCSMFRKMAGTTTLASYFYIKNVIKYWRAKKFDLLILDDTPQNIPLLRKYIPREKMAFLIRGQIGSSRRYLCDVAAIVATNPHLLEYAKTVMPTCETRPNLFVVPNALDDQVFNKHLYEKQRKTPGRTAIFAGRLIPEKGVLELLRAFHLVHQQLPDSKLYVVGGQHIGQSKNNVPSNYEMELRAFVSEVLPEAVVFAGHVDFDEMPSMYEKADIAVFPSTWVEGFGMVALEAMRVGIPVIVSNRPGFTSFVRHGENGIVVNNPTDPSELASAILELFENPSYATKLARAGYHTSTNYTPKAAAVAYQRMVKKIVK